MNRKVKVFFKYSGLLFLFYVLLLATIPRLPLINTETDKKIYIAFGFHVNLYHSFRADTNDEDGFGQDIRVLRHIIKTFDEYNKQGIPVKAVWDIENLFSLQEKLPRYAPDIIADIKRRVKENGDEIIPMSYNNGLMSGMTKKEFRESMSRAISNKAGSGVKDVFEKYSAIVRPQEMMATPGNYKLYQEQGLDTIVLYYSSITFDAFRMFARDLNKKEAHNPLWYANDVTKEKMRLLPAYNIGDLVENVSLRDWVQKLHREQRRKRIDSDIILFINFDGDSTFWEGLKLPPYLSWLPNTGGIKKLIETTKDLDYVTFTNLHSYLENHPPVGEVRFQQDLADGSFNGYNSWAEKSYVSTFWTAVVKNRYAQKTVAAIYDYLKRPISPEPKKTMEKSFEQRLRLLSTTNFGMATPFLVREREEKVKNIIHNMQALQKRASDAAQKAIRQKMQQIKFPLQADDKNFLQKVFVAQETNYVKINIPLGDLLQQEERFHSQVVLLKKDKNLEKKYSTLIVQQQKNFLKGVLKITLKSEQKIPAGVYAVYAKKDIREKQRLVLPATIHTRNFSVEFDAHGHIVAVKKSGSPWLLKESFVPMIEYGKNNYVRPKTFLVENYSNVNKLDIVMKADWSIPNAQQLQNGKVKIQIVSNRETLYVYADVLYPETTRTDVLKPSSATLIRKIDGKWRQVAPLPLYIATPKNKGERENNKKNLFQVNKENYLGKAVSYKVDYHRHHSDNKELANVNNHITSSYVGVSNNQGGIVVAYDSTTLANFAAMPLKINYKHKKNEPSVSVFAFGTAFGDQYYQPTWGTKNGFRSAFYTGEQFFSSAPTFNGHHYQVALRIDSHESRELSSEKREAAKQYSLSLETVSDLTSPELVLTEKSKSNISHSVSQIQTPAGFVGAFGKNPDTKQPGIFFYWENLEDTRATIVIEYGTNKHNLQKKVQLPAYKQKAFVAGFPKNTDIFARAYALSSSGEKTAKTALFKILAKEKFERENPLPAILQLNILYDTLLSYIN